jgi:hypothetical protein
MLCDMGTMINRRRVCGGKSLPYDAEIEYLESTGTQYIDTGVDVNFSANILEQISTLAFSVTNVRQLNGTNGWGYWGTTNKNYFECPGTTTSTTVGTDFHSVDYIFSKSSNKPHTVMYVDDNKIVDKTPSGTLAGYEYRVFIFAIGGRGGAAAQIFCREKLKSYQILIDNVVVRDYIPVRVGRVGYLYDKVSGQLFGNAGTGSFTLGHDKT